MYSFVFLYTQSLTIIFKTSLILLLLDSHIILFFYILTTAMMEHRLSFYFHIFLLYRIVFLLHLFFIDSPRIFEQVYILTCEYSINISVASFVFLIICLVFFSIYITFSTKSFPLTIGDIRFCTFLSYTLHIYPFIDLASSLSIFRYIYIHIRVYV